MYENEVSSETFTQKYNNFVDRYGLSGSVLKIIAIVTMLIDHIGAGIFENLMYNSNTRPPMWLWTADPICRNIGRIAFPIFCFLLVEGYTHTRNVWKYLGRLVAFGVIAEVPFDLAFFRSYWYVYYQNVFWTLALGVLMMILMDYAGRYNAFRKNPGLNRLATIVFDCFIFVGLSFVAEKACTDYGMLGVFTILLIYCFRGKRIPQLVATGIACWFVLNEPTALFCLIPLALYNGRRGFGMKYFFYIFYPAHLLIIWAVGFLAGLR